MKNLRPILLIAVITVCLHLVLLANKTYDCLGRRFYDRDQYHLFIASVENGTRDSYVTETQIKYFGELPEWAPNIFYAIELLILIMILRSPGKSKSEAIEQIRNLMLEVRIATKGQKPKA